MKNIERSLLYLLLAAVGILYIVTFTGNSNEEVVSDTDSAQVADQQVKHGLIYYVNTDSIWSNYKYVADAMKDMESRKSQYEGRLESRFKEFEKEVGQFQQNGATMTQVEQQLKQRELMRKESELGQLREQLEMKIMQEEQQWNDKLRQKIVSYIDSFTSDRNYDYILGYSRQSNIILANDSLDLTGAILRGLNEEYNLENTAK